MPLLNDKKNPFVPTFFLSSPGVHTDRSIVEPVDDFGATCLSGRIIAPTRRASCSLCRTADTAPAVVVHCHDRARAHCSKACVFDLVPCCVVCMEAVRVKTKNRRSAGAISRHYRLRSTRRTDDRAAAAHGFSPGVIRQLTSIVCVCVCALVCSGHAEPNDEISSRQTRPPLLTKRDKGLAGFFFVDELGQEKQWRKGSHHSPKKARGVLRMKPCVQLRTGHDCPLGEF